MDDGDGCLRVAAADVVQVVEGGLLAACGVALEASLGTIVHPHRPGASERILIKRKNYSLTYARLRALCVTLFFTYFFTTIHYYEDRFVLL